VKKRTTAIAVWAVAGLLFLIVGMATANAGKSTTSTPTASVAVSDPSATASDLPLPIETPSTAPAPKPAPKPAGPATFVMPDFTNMDENDVDTWMWNHSIDVSTEFDYGDSSGTDCEDAGDGIVEDQSARAGTRLKNSLSTDLYFSVYCDY
jgi:hypothetical protein